MFIRLILWSFILSTSAKATETIRYQQTHYFRFNSTQCGKTFYGCDFILKEGKAISRCEGYVRNTRINAWGEGSSESIDIHGENELKYYSVSKGRMIVLKKTPIRVYGSIEEDEAGVWIVAKDLEINQYIYNSLTNRFERKCTFRDSTRRPSHLRVVEPGRQRIFESQKFSSSKECKKKKENVIKSHKNLCSYWSYREPVIETIRGCSWRKQFKLKLSCLN